MPRNKKRSARSSKTGRRTAVIPSGGRVGRPLVSIYVPRTNLNFFPDIYRGWGQTDFVSTMTAAVGQSLQFKASDPLNLMGPRVDYAGAFAANVPAGIQYLVSSNNVAGAAAPYKYCLAERSVAEVELFGITTNNVPTQLTIMFNTLLDQTSGMSITHISELPFSKTVLLPCTQTIPSKISVSVNHWDLFGITEEVYKSSIFQYACAVGVPTGLPAYVTVTSRSLDGTTNRTDYFRIKIVTLFSFHQRNAFATNTPTLRAGDEDASSKARNEPWMVVQENHTPGGPGIVPCALPRQGECGCCATPIHQQKQK